MDDARTITIGDTTVTVEYSDRHGEDGRDRYRYTLSGGIEYTADDLQSGCGGGSVESGMSALLAFLAHASEWYSYHVLGNRPADDDAPFAPEVCEWAYMHDTEIQEAQIELEEREA